MTKILDASITITHETIQAQNDFIPLGRYNSDDSMNISIEELRIYIGDRKYIKDNLSIFEIFDGSNGYVKLTINAVDYLQIYKDSFLPYASNNFNLGSSNRKITNIYLGGAINLGGDQPGDVYFRDDGNLFQRLPIGQEEDILSVVEGFPQWVSIGDVFSVSWGDILGNIENQTDLYNLLTNYVTISGAAQTITSVKTFTSVVGVYIKREEGGSYFQINPNATNTGTAYIGTLTNLQLTNNRIWSLPDKTGTIALLSDLEGVGGDAVWGSITGTLSDQIDLQIALNLKEDLIAYGSGNKYFFRDKTWQEIPYSHITGVPDLSNLHVRQHSMISALDHSDMTGNRIIGRIGTSGTPQELTASDIQSFIGLEDYVTLATTQTITGTKTIQNTTGFTIKYGSGTSNLTIRGISGTSSNHGLLTTLSLSAARTWSLPNASGTLALLTDIPTVDLSGYVTLDTTQTITGHKTFNNAYGLTIKHPSYAGLLNIVSPAGSNSGNINTLSLTGIRTWSLPNKSGTIALLDDISSTVAWGNITGTLSDQTDLQSALDGKEPVISAGTATHYWSGNKTFKAVAYSEITGTPDLSGYLTDAPSNGNIYGRKDGAWFQITLPDGSKWTTSGDNIYRDSRVAIGTIPDASTALRIKAFSNTDSTYALRATNSSDAIIFTLKNNADIDIVGLTTITSKRLDLISSPLRFYYGGTGYTQLIATSTDSNLSFTLPNSLGTSGYAMTTDGNGVLDWGVIPSTITQLTAGNNKMFYSNNVGEIQEFDMTDTLGNIIVSGNSGFPVWRSAQDFYTYTNPIEITWTLTSGVLRMRIDHLNTAGNKHIPAGGSTGQFLQWASDGTAQWATISTGGDGAEYLGELLDVTLTSPASGHILQFNGSAWVNVAGSGTNNYLTDVDFNTSSYLMTFSIEGLTDITESLSHIKDQHITGASFTYPNITLNRTAGNFTIDIGHTHNYDNYQNWLLAVTGVAGTATISSTNTVTFIAGSNISISRSGSSVTINATTSGGDMTVHTLGGTWHSNVDAGVDSANNGDILSYNTASNKWIAVAPDSSWSTDYYVTSGSFNIETDILTLVRGALGGININLGLSSVYEVIGHTHSLSTTSNAGFLRQILATHDNKFLRADGTWQSIPEGGATTFLTLTDVTPNSYVDQGGKGVRVNSGETGLEFYTIEGGTSHNEVSLSSPIRYLSWVDNDQSSQALVVGLVDINSHTTGNLNINRLEGYPANNTLFLRGDGTWSTPPSEGDHSALTLASPNRYLSLNVGTQILTINQIDLSDSSHIVNKLPDGNIADVLTNKTYNGVTLVSNGSAGLYLNQQGNYVSITTIADVPSEPLDTKYLRHRLANGNVEWVVFTPGSGLEAHSLHDSNVHSDVQITNLQNNQVLKWNASLGKWTNQEDQVGEVGEGDGYINNASFSNGILSLSGTGAAGASVSLDGRYLQANQTITLTGDITGSGATSITTSYNGIVPVNKGGTSLSFYAQGDLLYASGTSTLAKLVKTAVANSYLRNSGTNNNPQWGVIEYSHIANTPTIPTVNNSTITINTSTGLSGGDSFTLNQASNKTITLSLNASLTNLTDVNITGATSGQLLRYNGSSWVNWTHNFSSTVGTVTSVALTVPTGLQVSGSPITSSGTLGITYAAGYSIPTNTSQSNWNTAYGWGDHSIQGYLVNPMNNRGDLIYGGADGSPLVLAPGFNKILVAATNEILQTHLQWVDLTPSRMIFTTNQVLLGRYSTGGGGGQQITLGNNLNLNSSGVLSAIGGASTFTDLSDTTNSYTGAANYGVFVNSGSSGLIFKSDLTRSLTSQRLLGRGTSLTSDAANISIDAGSAVSWGANSLSIKLEHETSPRLSSSLFPTTTNVLNIGSDTFRFKDIYAAKFIASTEFKLGSWVITLTGNDLDFKYNGMTKFRMKSDGDMIFYKQ